MGRWKRKRVGGWECLGWRVVASERMVRGESPVGQVLADWV